MRRINRARRNHGRRALDRDRQIGYVARRHASYIARNGAIWHDNNMTSEITRWRRLGQNTGRGRHCKSLFRAFMRSSGHRANIFGRWRFIGVGTRNRNGTLYVQIVFESRRNPGNVYSYP